MNFFILRRLVRPRSSGYVVNVVGSNPKMKKRPVMAHLKKEICHCNYVLRMLGAKIFYC